MCFTYLITISELFAEIGVHILHRLQKPVVMVAVNPENRPKPHTDKRSQSVYDTGREMLLVTWSIAPGDGIGHTYIF